MAEEKTPPQDPLSTDDLIHVLKEKNRSLEKELSLPRYEVQARLGEGATAVVYRAWDKELKRNVALKVLREATELTDIARARFRREAQATAQIAHPNVVAVYDAGEHEGRLYLVMELVEGKSLYDLLSHGTPERRAAVTLMEKAARGVAAAHARGIIHRDLKPGNFLMTPAGEPKVSDFGLAHLPDSTQAITNTGAILGTPLYMAPEQVDGKEVTQKTDVYALGAILYQMVTGRLPFQAENVSQLYRKIVRDDPSAPRKLVPDLPEDLETVILKALDHDPARRYASAGELADDLRRFLDGKPVEACPPSGGDRLGRYLRRNRAAVILWIAAAAWLTVLGISWSITHEQTRNLHKERAEALEGLRQNARVSVDAALRLRRAGDADGMRNFFPLIEAGYRKAQDLAPGTAEAEYLMGRMYRALMKDDDALACQNRALEKDPDYAPALYERIVLHARKYDLAFRTASRSVLAYEIGRTSTAKARATLIPTVEEAQKTMPEMGVLRHRLIADCEKLRALTKPALREDARRWMGPSHVLAAEGILAYCEQRYDDGRARLEETVKGDRLMEEAWEALARILERQEIAAHTLEDKAALRRRQEQIYTEALSTDVAYAPFYLGRGNVFMKEAVLKFRTGRDPQAELDAAERDFLGCLRVDSEHAEAWHRLAAVRIDRGRYLWLMGKDPGPEWTSAEQNLAQSLYLKRDTFMPWFKKGFLHLHRAAWQIEAGQDPAASLDAADEHLAESLRLTPGDADPWLWLGVLRTQRGLHLKSQGKDPLPTWATAELNLAQSARIAPQYSETWIKLSYFYYYRGLHRAEVGEDPVPDWIAAERAVTTSLEHEALHVDSRTLRGQIRIALGRRRLEGGGDPLPDWKGAAEDLSGVVVRGPIYVPAFQGLGDLAWHQASFLDARRDAAKAREAYAECVRRYEEALKLNPSLERTLGSRLAEARKRK